VHLPRQVYISSVANWVATQFSGEGNHEQTLSVTLGKTLVVGDLPVIIHTVTRLDQERFRIGVDLGPEANGRLLQYLQIHPARSSVTGGGSGSSFHLDPRLELPRPKHFLKRLVGPRLLGKEPAKQSSCHIHRDAQV